MLRPEQGSDWQLYKEDRTRLVLKASFCVTAPFYYLIGTRTFGRLLSILITLKLNYSNINYYMLM